MCRMTTTTDDPRRAAASLRPGDHIVLNTGIHEVRHVERTNTGLALLLKQNGNVCCRVVSVDNTVQVATPEEVAAARGQLVRARLIEDLGNLADLLGRPAVVPIGEHTSLYVSIPLEEPERLDEIATYLGVQVRSNDHTGRPLPYSTVQFPPALDIEEPLPLLVEFQARNPEYDR
jgi:hypothetical protein